MIHRNSVDTCDGLNRRKTDRQNEYISKEKKKEESEIGKKTYTEKLNEKKMSEIELMVKNCNEARVGGSSSFG